MDGQDNIQTEDQFVGPSEPDTQSMGLPEPEPYEPIAIDILAQDLIKLPHEEAIAKLKDAYSNNSWTDKELAAQEVAKVSHILNTGYGEDLTPKFNLDTDVITLSQKMLNTSLSDEARLEAVNVWQNDAKERLYNTDDVDSLMSATAKERLIDDYALQYRRSITAGDTGVILDGLTRGGEALLAPIADTADLMFDTSYGKKLRNFALEHENPNRDSDLTSTIASGVGAVSGFAVTALNPYTGLAYLGATLASQGKQVYDTALEESGSEEIAKNALLGSSPGIALGAFTDRLLGGTLAKTFKGQKGFLGAITGTTAGSVGLGAQTYLTGKALTEATGEEKFEPTLPQVAESALVGGLLGAAVGGIHDIANTAREQKIEFSFKKVNEQFKKIINKSEDGLPPPEQSPGVATSTDEFLNQFVKPEEESKPETLEKATADRMYSSLNQDKTTYTPEQMKALEQIDELVDKYVTIRDELASTEGYLEGPMTEKQMANRILHIERSIEDWSGDPDTKRVMQRRLADFKAEQKLYEIDPYRAQRLQAKKDSMIAMRDEALNIAITKKISIGDKASATFMYGDRTRPGMQVGEGETVLEAARAMPFREVIPEEMKSPLQKLIPLSPPGYTPTPMTVSLINRILGEMTDPANPHKLELANEADMGINFAYVDPATKRVVVRRQLFKNPEQARQTLAHEAGHILDILARTEAVKAKLTLDPSNNEPVAVKLIRMGEPLKALYSFPDILKEARDLSSQWRTGWDMVEEVPGVIPPEGTPERKKYDDLVYRNNPNELHADVMSAILEKPEFVKAMFSHIWNAFEAGLENQPILKSFWKNIQEMNTDPEKLSAFVREEWTKGRKKEAKITADKAEKDLLLKKTIKDAKLKEIPGLIRQYFGNKFAAARDVVEKLVNTLDADVVEELHGKLYSGPMNQINQRILIDEKEIVLIGKMKALGKEYGFDAIETSKDYDRINNYLNDTTETMISIEKNPQAYKEAFDIVQTEINKLIANDPKAVNPIAGIDVSQLSGRKLVAALAKTHLDLTKVDRDRLISDMLSSRGKNMSAADLKAVELLAEGSFDARRFIASPVMDEQVALTELSLMKNRLGEEAFNKMVKLNENHHDILFEYMYPRAKEAGIFTAKLLRRMELNKRSYVTNNAIKYFEKDPHISASVRKAIGNVDQIGDEWAATIRKIKMIGAKADYQISTNAGINIARHSGDKMTEIKPEMHFSYAKEGETNVFIDRLYDTQKKLQEKNPQNSYLIEMDNGRSTLWEIENPRWAQMYNHSAIEDMPIISTGLSLLESFNKMFGERELKTALSPGFWLRSKWYDVSQESLAGNAPWYDLIGLPFHTSSAFREQRSSARRQVIKMQKGEVTPEMAELIKHNGIPFHMTEESGGGYYNQALKAENVLYELQGIPIPGETELDIPTKMNRAINKAFDLIGFGKIRKAVETDELTAKMAMFLIGKNIKGMSPARAARFAREMGGTPDPYGGGNEASALNKLFLFGRAHVNGMRALYNMFKDDPKAFSMQYMYRKGVPRALMSSAIMGPLIGALFGAEDEKIYRKFLDKVPSFDKLSKFNIPLGFIDEKGGSRLFGISSISSDEINQNWKASYLALPMSRELVTTDTLMSPLFKNLEDYIETGAISSKNIMQSIAQSFNSAFTGQFAPGIMAATRIGQFASGGNPYDYYRNRGIFPKDVEEAGSLLDKTYRYLTWSLNSTAPGIFSFNRDTQSSTEPTSPWDYIGATPIAGATLRAFVRQSNYGDLEKYNENQQLIVERDAEIRLGMGAESKKLYNDYRKTQSYVSRMGKDWAEHSTPEQIRRVHILQNWHTRAYRYGFNGLRAAFENNDSEALKNESDKLENASSYVVDMLK